MEKEFIPYEQALALKELGFDEPCFGYYKSEKLEFHPFISQNEKKTNKYWLPLKIGCTAPLYQQAFDWFRGKYGYFQLFDFQVGDSKITKGFFFSIINIHNEDFFFPEDFENIIYKTYEEAELECLKKLIEIVRAKATSV
jgi:hypothetical protein